jgi:hypothetical protein
MNKLFLIFIVLISLFIKQAYAKVVNYENEWMGAATLISTNGNTVTLSIKRDSGTSTTILDCKRGLIKDTRFSNKFEAPDRQNPGIAYLDDFC